MRARKRQVDWVKVRDRLTAVVLRHRGGDAISAAHISWLASKTKVNRTTLRRFFHLIPSSETDSLQTPSIRKICAGLDLQENWLLHGVEAQQKGIWPAPVGVDPETLREQDPVVVLQSAVSDLVQISDRSVQILLGRAALIALLEAAGAQRVALPSACYTALVWFEESRNVA